ncbi:MetI-like domain [Moorella glycerini]|uniref:Trehalose transport system permease protein SugA n=1 Tax=Neomoorella stamsii TaxID=1266720 RepID=A0A9X7J5A7_9FIRM|nr:MULTISPECIES: sugar ABC transporter permease [Moorella]PRR77548.1 Trehalose transport system permease protein SugA [Moorella stamsii]CEP69405.1 MetI-like domain [Moorella glycerini]
MSILRKGDGALPHPHPSNMWKEIWTPFFMVTPAALFTLIMILFPIGYAVFLSLTKWTPGGGVTEFVGLSNFTRMLRDEVFWLALQVTIKLFIICLFFETLIGTYLGILLSRDIPGQKIFQALILVPSIIASVAIGMMWIQIYDPTLGAANYLLKLVGLKPLAWLGDPKTVLPSLAIIDIWEWTPFMALIVTGGMRALPTEPFEAALIDGATKWQTLIHITLPLLRPVIVVAMLLRSVDLIRFFDTIYIMTKGGPNNASTTLNVYSYLQGFNYMDMSYGSAIMLFLLLLVMAFSLVFSALRRRAN